MGDGVEVVEGDGGVVVLVSGITAFHGDDDGFGDVAEVGEVLAGEFVQDAQDGEFADEGLAGVVGDGVGVVSAVGVGLGRGRLGFGRGCRPGRGAVGEFAAQAARTNVVGSGHP